MNFIEEIQKSNKWGGFQMWWESKYPAPVSTLCNYPFSMQQGMFLEFLREQGIYITQDFTRIEPSKEKNFMFKAYIMDEIHFMPIIFNTDYNTGLQSAIIKAFNL